jgi:hypothetical protein
MSINFQTYRTIKRSLRSTLRNAASQWVICPWRVEKQLRSLLWR